MGIFDAMIVYAKALIHREGVVHAWLRGYRRYL